MASEALLVFDNSPVDGTKSTVSSSDIVAFAGSILSSSIVSNYDSFIVDHGSVSSFAACFHGLKLRDNGGVGLTDRQEGSVQSFGNTV